MNGSEIQVERGNYTRIHNAILEALSSTNFSGRELRCLLHLLRMTYGFNRKATAISLTEWSKATGIKRGHVNETLKELVQRNVIAKTDGNASAAAIWEFNKYSESWGTSTGMGTGFTGTDMGTGTSTQEGTGTSTPLMSTTEDTKDIIKDNSKESSSNDVPTAPTIPVTKQFAALVEELKTTKNRPAKLHEIYVLCYGADSAPTFAYLGRVAQQVGGAGHLAQMLWQHTTRPPVGDVLAYILTEHKAKEKRAQQNGSHRAVTEVRFAQEGDDIYA
jgi:phage replication O-like protein O